MDESKLQPSGYVLVPTVANNTMKVAGGIAIEKAAFEDGKIVFEAAGDAWAEMIVFAAQVVAQDLVSRLLTESEKLVERVAFDMNGNLIGGKWMGGHGGLISQETMRATDEVRRAASALRALEGGQDA